MAKVSGTERDLRYIEGRVTAAHLWHWRLGPNSRRSQAAETQAEEVVRAGAKRGIPYSDLESAVLRSADKSTKVVVKQGIGSQET